MCFRGRWYSSIIQKAETHQWAITLLSPPPAPRLSHNVPSWPWSPWTPIQTAISWPSHPSVHSFLLSDSLCSNDFHRVICSSTPSSNPAPIESLLGWTISPYTSRLKCIVQYFHIDSYLQGVLQGFRIFSWERMCVCVQSCVCLFSSVFLFSISYGVLSLKRLNSKLTAGYCLKFAHWAFTICQAPSMKKEWKQGLWLKRRFYEEVQTLEKISQVANTN